MESTHPSTDPKGRNKKMSLECLAILGIKNEPIYLCTPGAKDSDDATTGSDQQDVFGFLETDTNSSGLTIRQEVNDPDISNCDLQILCTVFCLLMPAHHGSHFVLFCFSCW